MAQYEKNGRPWQDFLKPGDYVFVEHWKPQEDGFFSVDGRRTQIAAVGEATIQTLEGEMFDKSSLRGVDPFGSREHLELCPTETDDVRMAPPSLEELIAQGMSPCEAQEFLKALKEE